MAKKKSAGCEYCSNYVYDEDYEYYVCDINLDEDEMARFMSYSDWDCPYFQMDDEYAKEKIWGIKTLQISMKRN